ncbi:WD40 repeat-like protein, partial [Lepidopterella palustris CBS 459.81]
VTISSDGQLVASGSVDRTVRLWDATTGEVRATLQGHSNAVESVAISADGQLVASGSQDGTVRLWDAATGAVRATHQGHSHAVESVAVSADGRLVASGSSDGTVKLWNLATRAAEATLLIGTVVRNLSFSILGQYLIADMESFDIRSLTTLVHVRSNSLQRLLISNNWIAEEDEDILWLPPEYRPTRVAIANGVIALGFLSGIISILEFKPGEKTIQ